MGSPWSERLRLDSHSNNWLTYVIVEVKRRLHRSCYMHTNETWNNMAARCASVPRSLKYVGKAEGGTKLAVGDCKCLLSVASVKKCVMENIYKSR